MYPSPSEAADILLKQKWFKLETDKEVLEVHCMKCDDVLMDRILRFAEKYLSEPYSRYTYRSLIFEAPDICLTLFDGLHNKGEKPLINDISRDGELCGVVVNKLDPVSPGNKEDKVGYLGVIVLHPRKWGIGLGKFLTQVTLELFRKSGVRRVLLDTEATNTAALRLYDKLGFVRVKREFRFYCSEIDGVSLLKVLDDLP